MLKSSVSLKEPPIKSDLVKDTVRSGPLLFVIPEGNLL
jgi:hypothetical protein